MSLSALLDLILTLQRPTIAQDASGAAVRTYANLLQNIPCAVAPANAKVVNDYARRDMIVNYTIYTTLDLDVVVTGGVKLGDRLTDGTLYYLIKDVKRAANAQISSEVLYQLDCERRRV